MSERLTVLDMVSDALRAGGYDGLTSGECGCELADLMTCDLGQPNGCVAGHKVPHKVPCVDECDCIWPHGWHIMAGPRP